MPTTNDVWDLVNQLDVSNEFIIFSATHPDQAGIAIRNMARKQQLTLEDVKVVVQGLLAGGCVVGNCTIICKQQQQV